MEEHVPAYLDPLAAPDDLHSPQEQVPLSLQCSDNEDIMVNAWSSSFGTDGIFTQIGEHIPLLNQGIQEIHKKRGEMGAYMRARERNPVGADGVVTQACEHIPLVCDGIEALHRINGQHSAAERASARSLPRLLSKDGALTKVAELIPGTNIVAAMMHEMNGNHDEAVRALSIFDNWTQVGEPDGPLAKLAELFPGMDVVAFALHVTNKQYAQALRSITKTTWVNLRVSSVTIKMSGRQVWDFSVSQSKIKKLEVEPKAISMILGINDLFTKFLELDARGNVRPKSLQRESPSSRKQREEDLAIVGVETEELLSNWVNDILRYLIRRMKEDMPEYVNWTMDAVNEYTFPRWRQTWRYYILLRPTMKRPSPAFSKALQEAFARASIRHLPLDAAADRVVLPPLRFSLRRRVCRAAVAGGALGAASYCGAKAAALTCFGGVMMAAASLCNYATRRLYGHFNASNTECWEGAALRCDDAERLKIGNAESHGLILDMDEADAALLVQLVRDHIVSNIRCGCLAAPLLRMMLPRLKAMFRRWGTEWQTVPFVMDVETGDLDLETQTWPDGLKLPSLRIAILCDLNIVGTEASQVQVVIPDGLLDQFAQRTRQQMEEIDLRTQDPRLAGFTEPLNLLFDLSLEWTELNELALELRNLRSTLYLPE